MVTHFSNILIIDSDGERMNIVLPEVWNANSEVLNVSQMFEDYIAIGDTISVKTLQSGLTNKHDVTITAILAYEITVGDCQIFAVLPFNVDTDE